MVTPASTVAVPTSNAAGKVSVRAVVLWLVFAATLLAGLVLAVRFGASAPVLIEDVRR